MTQPETTSPRPEYLNRAHDYRPRRVPATVLSRFSIACVGVFAIAQGVVISMSQPTRFGGSSYSVVSQIAGGMKTWGVVLLLLGVTVLSGSRLRSYWLKTAGVAGVALWCVAFGLGAWTAVMTVPVAGPTGPCVYFALAAMSLVLCLVDETESL